MSIKTPVRYCAEDWMLFDADDQWLASFDAGDVGPEVAAVLNERAALVAERDALREALSEIAAGQCCGSPGCCFAYPRCDVMIARAALEPDLVGQNDA